METQIIDKHTANSTKATLTIDQERAEMRAIIAKWIAAGRITIKREVLELPAKPKAILGGIYSDPEVIRKMLAHEGPFTPKQAMTISGINQSNITNVVARWLTLGWVRRHPDGEYGEYERTEKFGQMAWKIEIAQTESQPL